MPNKIVLHQSPLIVGKCDKGVSFLRAGAQRVCGMVWLIPTYLTHFPMLANCTLLTFPLLCPNP